MKTLLTGMLLTVTLSISLESNIKASELQQNSEAQEAEVIIKHMLKRKMLKPEFNEEQKKLTDTFLSATKKSQREEIQEATRLDYSEWIQTNPKDNRVGFSQNLTKYIIRIHSVTRDPNQGPITQLNETYLLTVIKNTDTNKLNSAVIDDQHKYASQFDPKIVHMLGSQLQTTNFSCRFDIDLAVGRKGILIPLMNTKIEYHTHGKDSNNGEIDKAITVETDGHKLLNISVIVTDNGVPSFVTLMNSDEIMTEQNKGNGAIEISDYDTNTFSAGSAPLPIPIHLRCKGLDNGMPGNMGH